MNCSTEAERPSRTGLSAGTAKPTQKTYFKYRIVAKLANQKGHVLLEGLACNYYKLTESLSEFGVLEVYGLRRLTGEWPASQASIRIIEAVRNYVNLEQ